MRGGYYTGFVVREGFIDGCKQIGIGIGDLFTSIRNAKACRSRQESKEYIQYAGDIKRKIKSENRTYRNLDEFKKSIKKLYRQFVLDASSVKVKTFSEFLSNKYSSIGKGQCSSEIRVETDLKSLVDNVMGIVFVEGYREYASELYQKYFNGREDITFISYDGNKGQIKLEDKQKFFKQASKHSTPIPNPICVVQSARNMWYQG